MGRFLGRGPERWITLRSGLLFEELGRLLEMAHDQPQEMQPGTMRFEKFVKLKAAGDEVFLLVQDLFGEAFDEQLVSSLEDLHRGPVLVQRQVTHRGNSLHR